MLQFYNLKIYIKGLYRPYWNVTVQISALQDGVCARVIKMHSDIAHQYGAFKICLMMMSGEMGQYAIPPFQGFCYKEFVWPVPGIL